jgi:hypothetical protein
MFKGRISTQWKVYIAQHLNAKGIKLKMQEWVLKPINEMWDHATRLWHYHNVVSESGKESVVDPNSSSITQLNMSFATFFLHATITPIFDTKTGKEWLWVMLSDIRTNARDINFDRIMSGTVDRTVITRHPMSLIFYEEATVRGMVLTDMIDGTKVVPNFLAGPITSERVGHMKQVR